MSIRRIAALGVIALAVTACDDDEPTGFSNGPRAFVRVINAMPDSGAVDFRFVDQVDNTTAFGLAFGQASNYDNVAAGARQIRVFRNGGAAGNIAVATQVVVEGSQTFEAGRFYTVVLGGRREGNAGAITVINDDTTTIAARAANKFALRAYNLSGTTYDVYYRTGPAATALPGTVLATSLASGAASPWASPDTASAVRVSVHTPGTPGTAITDAQVTVGAPGTTSVNPVGGSRAVGAAVTAFILPPCSAGTATSFAGATANCAAAVRTTPRVQFLVDRQGTATAP